MAQNLYNPKREFLLFLYFLNWGIVHLQCCISFKWGFLGGSDDKESACNMGDPGPIPGSRRSPGEGNGYPLQYSCLENSMDTRMWTPGYLFITLCFNPMLPYSCWSVVPALAIRCFHLAPGSWWQTPSTCFWCRDISFLSGTIIYSRPILNIFYCIPR